MSLVYVTGISGSGKSAVRNELRKRGYEAYGTDEDGLAAFYNKESGAPAGNDVAGEIRTEEWRGEHAWKMPREAVEALAKSARMPVFLCGVVSNDDEFWDLFPHVIALMVDEETLVRRLKTRAGNDFGKSDHELRGVLAWQKTARDDYIRLGATLIDATRPLGKVVDDIIEISIR